MISKNILTRTPRYCIKKWLNIHVITLYITHVDGPVAMSDNLKDFIRKRHKKDIDCMQKAMYVLNGCYVFQVYFRKK
jgi:hypothetical protein